MGNICNYDNDDGDDDGDNDSDDDNNDDGDDDVGLHQEKP